MGRCLAAGRSRSGSARFRCAWRRIRSSRRASSCGLWESLGHSAHVGQEVEVFYCWHPLYGRRVRRQYSQRRANGEVVHVEVGPGVVIVVAAWMLNAAACARMGLGAPRASADALAELHLLLLQRGLRRSCAGVRHTCEERHDLCTQTAPTVDDIGSATATSTPASTEHGIRESRSPRHGPERTGRRDRADSDPAAAGIRRSGRWEQR